MKNMNFKQWLSEQGPIKQVLSQQDKNLNAEIEKAIINLDAKGGESAKAMGPATKANIIMPDLLRNQAVKKAVQEKIKQSTETEIKIKDEEAKRKAQMAQKTTGTPATVKTI